MLTPRVGGGDTATLPNDVLSPRTLNSQANQRAVEPTSVPGLDLSPRANTTRHTARDLDEGGTYISNRLITPHKWQGSQKENFSPLKEFGVQTDTPPPDQSPTKAQHSPSKVVYMNIIGFVLPIPLYKYYRIYLTYPIT